MNNLVASLIGFFSLLGGQTVKVGPLSYWESSLGKNIRNNVEWIASKFKHSPIFGRIICIYVEIIAQFIASLAVLSSIVINLVIKRKSGGIPLSNAKLK